MTPPTHTEPPRMRRHLPDKSRMRELYEGIAPVLAIVTILAAFSAVGWSWQNERANDRQDEQRITDTEARQAENAALLECFDDFASQLAGGLPPVREATVERDAAIAAAFIAIRNALTNLTGDGSQLPAVLKALDAVVVANENLTQVRADNPYPAAPSEFCADRP